MIRFSKKKWLLVERPAPFKQWYIVYRKVFLCFYRRVSMLPGYYINRWDSEEEINRRLQSLFEE